MAQYEVYTYPIVTWVLTAICGIVAGVFLSILILIVPLFFR